MRSDSRRQTGVSHLTPDAAVDLTSAVSTLNLSNLDWFSDVAMFARILVTEEQTEEKLRSKPEEQTVTGRRADTSTRSRTPALR